MDATRDLYNFEVKWHPFMLDPSLPKEGLDKNEFHRKKFGSRDQTLINTVDQAFQSAGYRFGSGGLIGNTLDSHRLIELAGRQGLDKQNALVDGLMIQCLTQEKYIGDREVLLAAAKSAGIDGAEEWIDNPNSGLLEVQTEMEKCARNISGVPHFLINKKYQQTGAQAPDSFIQTFKRAACDAEGNC